jgi:hypothetical protein
MTADTKAPTQILISIHAPVQKIGTSAPEEPAASIFRVEE